MINTSDLPDSSCPLPRTGCGSLVEGSASHLYNGWLALPLQLNNIMYLALDVESLCYGIPYGAVFRKHSNNGFDMVTHINYNGGKQVDYVYNSVGNLLSQLIRINAERYLYHPDAKHHALTWIQPLFAI